MKNLGKFLILGLVYIVGAYFICAVIASYLEYGAFTPAAFTSATTMTFFPILVLAGALIFLPKLVDYKPKKKDGKLDAGTGTDADGNKTNQYLSSRFTTAKEFKESKQLNNCKYSTLKTVSKDGILVRAEKIKNDIDINFVDPIHTLLIGTTGSGKSTRFLEPMVQIMSQVKSKPSFIISDPKGEIYEHNLAQFTEQGYRTVVYDLDNPFNSIKWNPMSAAYDKYHRALRIEKELKTHPSGERIDTNRIDKTENFNEGQQSWYEFDRKAYINKEMLFNDMNVLRLSLIAESYQELEDFAQCICPIKDKNNPSWEQAAQNLILGTALAMLEDSIDPRLGMTKKKFIPYNLGKICNHKTAGRDQYASLKKYFEHREKMSKVPMLISTALHNADTTTRNYMGFVTNAMSMFNDMGVCLCTSGTEIDFKHFSRTPTAFFVKIPDYIHTRDPLATLCFSQIYKKLVEEAMTNPKPGATTKTLERHVYFLLDEFANLPPFPSFTSTISVARSRGIFFVLAVQSFSQLNGKYGDADAKVIRDNLPITVYMGTDDLPTNEEFSKKLGNKSIEMKNVNTSKQDGKENKSESKQVVSIPLVEPLALPIDSNIWTDSNVFITYYSLSHPIKAVITPYFKAQDIYNIKAPKIPYVGKTPFNEKEVFYDIEERNRIVEGKKDDDDDDMFDLFK